MIDPILVKDHKRTLRNAQMGGLAALTLSLMPLSPAPTFVRVYSPVAAIAVACWQCGESEREKRLYRRIQAYHGTYESAGIAADARALAQLPSFTQMEAPKLKPALFDAQALLEEATGIGLLGNSGSGKSCVAKYLAGEFGDAQIIVLDPHDDPDETNWEGLHVLRDYDLIIEQMEIFLELLNKRDKTPVVIISEEFPAVRAYCKRKRLQTADEFILRIGSEARKFNKFPIFCSQSGNVKALGLENMGDFLENFMLVRFNRIATKYAKNLSDRDVQQALSEQGYKTLVNDSPAIHPTHGRYQQVRKGQPPIGLRPLQSQPITIPLAGQSPRDSMGNNFEGVTVDVKATIPNSQFPIPNSPPPSPVRCARWRELRELREDGVSKTQIIKEVWGYNNRNFQAGIEEYESLVREYAREWISQLHKSGGMSLKRIFDLVYSPNYRNKPKKKRLMNEFLSILATLEIETDDSI
ncbi:ATP-binding protein [Lusitaniella coriacea LEGE 07157]|uniref:ATP-binding protein n=1 Tax=Lusitaniella coriacea LEGE 07157 TaxID=945747 RepID=A0A8J7E093_9CYAN|nr:ATP-binding protein [Lusitaniella coriacea]MBE9119061.1 ATP-binding protein [Lusitaniella coriacea LEGE 07157]